MKTAKDILITGASGNIGAEVKDRLTGLGYRVWAPGRGELDLSSESSIEAYCQTLPGQLFGLVHCAAVNQPKPFAQYSTVELSAAFQINVLSFVRLVQLLAPRMSKSVNGSGGSIVAVSSIYGSIARRHRLAYAMSKHALNGVIKTLALELGVDGIRVNGISPGFIDTRLTRQNNSAEVIRDLEKRTVVDRLGNVAEIAEALIQVLEGGPFWTGHDLVVDGGYSIGGFQV